MAGINEQTGHPITPKRPQPQTNQPANKPDAATAIFQHHMAEEQAQAVTDVGTPTNVARAQARREQSGALQQIANEVGREAPGPGLQHPAGPPHAHVILKAIGFTGNGITDANTNIARIWQTYQDAFGQPPTPGMVMDALRSPASYDPEALRNLWNGVPQQSEPQSQAPGPGLANLTPQQRVKRGTRLGLRSALVASVVSGHDVVTPLAEKVLANKNLGDLQKKADDSVKVYSQTGNLNESGMGDFVAAPHALVAKMSSIGYYLKNSGLRPSTFDGKSLQQSIRIMNQAIPTTAGTHNVVLSQQDAMKTFAEWQRRMIQTYKPTTSSGDKLTASGVLSDDWARFLSTLSQSEGYRTQALGQMAIDAGFGSFDPFNAINQDTGKWANNSDGRAARNDVQAFIDAQIGRNNLLTNKGGVEGFAVDTLGRRVIEGLPLQSFDRGGFSLSHSLGYVFGGGGDFNPLHNPLTAMASIGSMVEQGLYRGVGGYVFPTVGGLTMQAKTDIYAVEPIIDVGRTYSGGHGMAHEMARRLVQENPTWLGIVTNNQSFADKHAAINFATNLIGDILVFRKVGATGETADARYLLMLRSTNNAETALSYVRRSNYIKERIDQSFTHLKSGYLGKADAALDSPIMGRDVLTEQQWALREGEGVKLAPDEVAQNAMKWLHHDNAVAKRAAELEKEGVSASDAAKQAAKELESKAPEKLTTVEGLVKGGHMNRDAYNQLIANEAVGGRLFTTWLVKGVPARSHLFWQRSIFGLPMPHPIAFTTAKSGDLWGAALDRADATLSDSTIPGTTGLGHAITNVRTMFMRAANYRKLPPNLMDSENVYRLALRAGMPVRQARAMQGRFIRATSSEGVLDAADFEKIQQEIGAAAIAQGRRGEASGLSNLFGVTTELEPINQAGALDQLIKETEAHIADNPEDTHAVEELALYREFEGQVSTASTPALRSESSYNFAVPQLGIPRSQGLIGWANGLNTKLLKFSQYLDRRLKLVTDPILFWKHATTDSIRRLIAIGGPRGIAQGERGWRELQTAMRDNPEMGRLFDVAHDIAKNSEMRYDVEGAGTDLTNQGFNSGDYLKSPEHLHAAASYVHRTVMGKEYDAYAEAGQRGLFDYYTTNPETIKLAAREGVPPQVLAKMAYQRFEAIKAADPNFLPTITPLVRGAKDARALIAKYMKKHDINIPVSGSAPETGSFRTIMELLDDASSKTVGFYLKANKWNRGGLFREATGRAYRQFVKDGMDQENAFKMALSVGLKINRYHMLDLADALQIEQTFRWGAVFFTKHRLYWSWLAKTMYARPQLAAAFEDITHGMDQAFSGNQGTTRGTYDFQIPISIPGMLSPLGKQVGLSLSDIKGGHTTFELPIARLLWLSQTQAKPGTLGLMASALAQGKLGLPWRMGIDITTIDSSLNQLYLLGMMKLGKVTSSNGVENSLSPQDRIQFRQIMARVQFGHHVAHPGAPPLDDAAATKTALLHMVITGAWRSAAPTAAYPVDPRFSTDQQKVWQQYLASDDPGQRSRILGKNPFIAEMMGVYTQSSIQHTTANQLWDKFNQIRTAHETRQDALLTDYRATGNVSDLFGRRWNEEGAQYQKQINGLLKHAKSLGDAGAGWVKQWNSDPLAQVHAQFTSSLHDMFPTLPTSAIEKVAKAARPPWVAQYRAALSSWLSRDQIALLPPEDQKPAGELRAHYETMIAAFWKMPAGKAEIVRDAYFTKVYGPWQTKRQGLFKVIDTTDKSGQGVLFDQMRTWLDKQDHPFVVNGVTMPSPVATHFAMLPKEAQDGYMRRIRTNQWGYLTRFDKKLLGVYVPNSVQDGWTYFQQSLYDAVLGPKGTIHKAGLHPTITDAQAITYAKYVDTQYPGFFADYTRGLVPTYDNLAKQDIGSTAGSRQAWKGFFGMIRQWSVYAAGTDFGVNEPVKLAARDALFRKQIWGDLMATGRAGIVGGIPLGTPPSADYPQGGYFYQQAMAQPNATFRNEFQAWMIQDPDFLMKLFPASDTTH